MGENLFVDIMKVCTLSNSSAFSLNVNASSPNRIPWVSVGGRCARAAIKICLSFTYFGQCKKKWSGVSLLAPQEQLGLGTTWTLWYRW